MFTERETYYEKITREFGRQTTDLLKVWSNISTKLARQRNRRAFLLACKRNELTPPFISNNIRCLASLRLERPGNFRRAERLKDKLVSELLSISLNSTNDCIRDLSDELSSVISKLKTVLPVNTLRDFKNHQSKKYNKYFKMVKCQNIIKLDRLKESATEKCSVNVDKWFSNNSSKVIPHNVQQFLALGAKFSLPVDHNSINIPALLSDLEIISSKTNDQNEFRSRTANIVTNYLHGSESGSIRVPFQKMFMRWKTETKHFLKHNPDIVVTNADKGNRTVILDKTDYHNKSIDLIASDKTYVKLNKDPTNSIKKRHNEWVDVLKSKGYIDEQIKKQLKCQKATSPKFYGLPKIHKENVPLRPIISACGSPTQNLSIFVAEKLGMAFKQYNSYRILNSFDFAKSVNNFQLPLGFVVISLDVQSLFTNIPLELVVRVIDLNWSLIEEVTSIDRLTFINIVKFLFESTYFSYDDVFYKQTFGTPMGSNLSPIVADIVMNYLLKTVIPTLGFELPFIYQYVDDILCSVPEDKVESVLNKFNNFNKHLQFTVEEEDENNGVPFLDTKAIRTEGNIVHLDWYRKPTASGRFLNFYSYHDVKQKTNLVIGLKNRIQQICHPSFLQKNQKILLDLLIDNNYPKSFLKPLIYNSPKPRILTEQLQPEQPEEPKTFLTLQYNHYITPKIKHLLRDSNVTIASASSHNIGDHFTKLKDKVPTMDKSNVIYSIPCLDCEKIYIGQTCQHLKHRVTQHKSDCKVKPNACGLAIHYNKTKHKLDFDNVKVITTENNQRKREVLEVFHINKNKTICLNNKKDIDQMNNIFSWLISYKPPKYKNYTKNNTHLVQ